MSQPYIGEIRMFGGNFAPQGWLFCDGSLLQISQYDALFNLIGTTYGGDGQSTFGLPNLLGRVPVHAGANPGTIDGTETVTLVAQQMPTHSHAMSATKTGGNQSSPGGHVTAASSSPVIYIVDVTDTNMASAAVNNQGGSQSHNNLQPFLCVNFIIALYGVFPPRS